MFFSDTVDEAFYADIMEQIKRLNTDYVKENDRGSLSDRPIIRNLRKDFKNGDMRGAVRHLKGYIMKKTGLTNDTPPDGGGKADYFSSERIAVYTAITGGYDRLMEPYCRPDNCDYFAFTDSGSDDPHSAWKRISVPAFPDAMSDAERSRYVKMHPHELFPGYEYSVYVDGNVQIMTDMTEYVNKIGPAGIGIHMHPIRDCVFEEAERAVRLKKADPDDVRRHESYLRDDGMPEHYGMLECCVIARRHHDPLCVKIMDDWWDEYEAYSKRDQISLPHVLFRNGISVSDVGTLGPNVRLNPSFRIYWHG